MYMIFPISTEEFSDLDIKGKKKIFAQFFGHTVNEIVYGAMTNKKCGEYRVRHEGCAYSNLRVEPSLNGLTHIMIWNFEEYRWQERA